MTTIWGRGVSLEVDSLAVPRLPFSTVRGGEEREEAEVETVADKSR